MTELHELTIADARDMLASGEITALELTQALPRPDRGGG